MSDTATATVEDWRAVATELAAVLQIAVLRNPNVTARDWTRARAALERYEQVGGAQPMVAPEIEVSTEG